LDINGPEGMETRSSQNVRNNMIEKTIPAIAAAFGVLRLLLVKLSSCGIRRAPLPAGPNFR
jgi:hypothetical protein